VSDPETVLEWPRDGARYDPHVLLPSPQAAGVKLKDWVLAVNGVNVKYKSHDEVVRLVKECREKVTLEITTPAEGNSTRQ